MDTKFIRTFLIILQIIISASVLLGCICGIASSGSLKDSRDLIECVIRCIASLGFTIFYYSSVSDSFSSDSLIFPLYLLCLSISETRMFEKVEEALHLFFIPQHVLVGVLIFSSFMIVFCLIGYAMLTSSSKRDYDLFTTVATNASLTIAFYSPKAQTINETWNPKVLVILLSALFAAGIIVSIVQAILETSVSSRIKYFVCMLLLVNDYINLKYNTVFMNTVGTILYIVSLILIVLLVRINSTRL